MIATATAIVPVHNHPIAHSTRGSTKRPITSGRIAISMMVTISGTAATLNAHGITDIQTSAQAAEALRPIAGVFTFALFAAGIIGIGLLAVPVLAGSGTYALGEALGWTTGLDRKPLDARAFYGTIAVSTLIGIVINFVGLDPITALLWSAVINGVVAGFVVDCHSLNPRLSRVCRE
jgi:Mn2+/Fe2+ NRAMP family transporter